MIIKIILFIIFNINFYNILSRNNNDVIRFAFILSRTGSHSPSYLKKINHTYYKDFFGYYWISENELTTVGKRQQFYLGYINNLKYKNLLIPENYHPKDILAYSSEKNKTIQSSYANLHGLYQNTNNKLTKEQIELAIPPLVDGGDKGYIDEKKELDKNNYILPKNMQIVPVHSFMENKYNYLLEKIENCPKLKSYYEEGESLAKKKIEEILNYKNEGGVNKKTYGEILVEILNKENTFKNNYTINDLKNNSTLFKLIAETFICDYFEAVNLDKFTNKGVNVYKLLNMFEEYFGEISIGGGIINKADERAKKTLELSEKVNYNLFVSLVEWMKLKVKNDIDKNFNIRAYDIPKIVIYFSHHDSIESLYYFLKETFNIANAQNSLYVNFTSFIGIELYRNKNEDENITEEDFYIKLIYNNEQLGTNIPYKYFYEILKSKFISFNEIKNYCGINDENNINNNNNSTISESSDFIFKIMGIIIMGIVPLLFSYVIFIIYRIKRRKLRYIDITEEGF
jgi:hypothetical protein